MNRLSLKTPQINLIIPSTYLEPQIKDSYVEVFSTSWVLSLDFHIGFVNETFLSMNKMMEYGGAIAP